MNQLLPMYNSMLASFKDLTKARQQVETVLVKGQKNQVEIRRWFLDSSSASKCLRILLGNLVWIWNLCSQIISRILGVVPKKKGCKPIAAYRKRIFVNLES